MWGSLLTGPLPAGLSELRVLRYLDLSENRLTGKIDPEAVAPLAELVSLDLRANKFSGRVPADLPGRVGRLFLSGNRLRGMPPSSLGALESLVYISMSGNRLEGLLPTSWARLPNLAHLSLAKNRLSGPVSVGFCAGLPSLRYLSLWGNRLSGRVPDAVSKLRALTFLNLSDNFFNHNAARLQHLLPSAQVYLG